MSEYIKEGPLYDLKYGEGEYIGHRIETPGKSLFRSEVGTERSHFSWSTEITAEITARAGELIQMAEIT